jgi:hypothetical protein
VSSSPPPSLADTAAPPPSHAVPHSKPPSARGVFEREKFAERFVVLLNVRLLNNV